jgi:nicotinamide riboside transporter PnuC
MSYVIAVLSLIGVILNIKKIKYGFVVWIFTNAYWCIHDFSSGQYAQSGLFFVYFILAVWGVIEWSKGDSK